MGGNVERRAEENDNGIVTIRGRARDSHMTFLTQEELPFVGIACDFVAA